MAAALALVIFVMMSIIEPICSLACLFRLLAARPMTAPPAAARKQHQTGAVNMTVRATGTKRRIVIRFPQKEVQFKKREENGGENVMGRGGGEAMEGGEQKG